MTIPTTILTVPSILAPPRRTAQSRTIGPRRFYGRLNGRTSAGSSARQFGVYFRIDSGPLFGHRTHTDIVDLANLFIASLSLTSFRIPSQTAPGPALNKNTVAS